MRHSLALLPLLALTSTLHGRHVKGRHPSSPLSGWKRTGVRALPNAACRVHFPYPGRLMGGEAGLNLARMPPPSRQRGHRTWSYRHRRTCSGAIGKIRTRCETALVVGGNWRETRRQVRRSASLCPRPCGSVRLTLWRRQAGEMAESVFEG